MLASPHPMAAESRIRTRLGLVSQAFAENDLRDLPGYIAVGHARYSTAGSSAACNAGPIVATSELGDIAVSHNGNLTNAVCPPQGA